jgi:hypothetical protein
VGRFCFLEPAGVAEQYAQVVVAYGQILAEFGSVGEFGGQLLLELDGLAVGCLRFLQLTQAMPHQGDAEVPFGADGPAVGVVGRDRRQPFELLDDLTQELLVLLG